MKYKIGDIVLFEEKYKSYGQPHRHKQCTKEGIIIGYKLYEKIPIYKVWILQSSQGLLGLFRGYRNYNTREMKNEISEQIFKKMFKRTAPLQVQFPVFETEKGFKQYLESLSGSINNYQHTIINKIGERDNEKYNKVLKTIEKSKSVT